MLEWYKKKNTWVEIDENNEEDKVKLRKYEHLHLRFWE